MSPQTLTVQPDVQALALTKAIRQTESGGNYGASGDNATSSGAYQYQASTWKQYAGEILGNPNAPMTPENQNAVTYAKVKLWKDQGLGPAEIAAAWNAGEQKAKNGTWVNNIGVNNINGKDIPYNTPQYAQNVVNNFKQIYPQVQQQYGTPAVQQDQGMSVGGFIQNVGSSAVNLASGIGQAVMHPIDTLSNLGGAIGGAIEKPFGVDNADTQKFDAIVNYFGNRYGGDSASQIAHNIVKTAYTDPVGTALDLSTLFSGGASLAGKVGKFADIAKATDLAKAADFVSTPAGIVAGGSQAAIDALKTPGAISKVANGLQTAADMTNPLTPVTKAISAVAEPVISGAKTLVSQMLNLDPKVMETVLNNPEITSKMYREQLTRGNLAEEFGKALDSFEQSKSAAGSGYEVIRNTPGYVSVPENFFANNLKKFGLDLTPEGKVVANTESLTRNTADINAIQKFVNDWGNQQKLTPKEFLNMRSDLADLANYDKLGTGGKTKDIQVIAHSLRDEANSSMRPQVNGLKKLDETNAPLIEQFKQAKKDFLVKTADGYEFKTGAINKIANAVGKGKDDLLSRMEAISPGITKKIELVKTAESIEANYGLTKPQSYLKSLVAFSGLTGNMTAILATIISHPSVAIYLLRGAGYTARTVKPILATLRVIAGDPVALKYAAEAANTLSATSVSPTY